MVMLGEKLSGKPTDRSADMLGIVSGAFFLWSSMVHPMLLMASERLPRLKAVCRKRTSDVRGLTQETFMLCVSGFSVQGVHQFESLRLSDISNCLFMAVFTELINDIIFINRLMTCFTLILALLLLFGLVQIYLV
jgi:hypothetical protein